jgi:hypothetical protein
MAERNPPTHAAYALKREGLRAAGRWIEIGSARIEGEAANGHHVFLDRLPVGGFSGHIYPSPVGVKPLDPEAQPQRPAPPSEEEDS